MKHTPGPWEDQGSCSSGHEIKAKVAHIGEELITLFYAPNMRDVSFKLTEEGELWGLLCYEQYVQFPSKIWEGMQEANVRLITAAPDMIAALKEIAKGDGAFDRDPLVHASNCIENMESLAKAAIKKAERGKR